MVPEPNSRREHTEREQDCYGNDPYPSIRERSARHRYGQSDSDPTRTERNGRMACEYPGLALLCARIGRGSGAGGWAGLGWGRVPRAVVLVCRGYSPASRSSKACHAVSVARSLLTPRGAGRGAQGELSQGSAPRLASPRVATDSGRDGTRARSSCDAPQRPAAPQPPAPPLPRSRREGSGGDVVTSREQPSPRPIDTLPLCYGAPRRGCRGMGKRGWRGRAGLGLGVDYVPDASAAAQRRVG